MLTSLRVVDSKAEQVLSGRVRGSARAAAVLLLLLAYWAAFPTLHREIGNPAFLFALIPCIVAGVLLGPRMAFGVVVATVLLDRWSALSLPPGPETAKPALLAAVATKLMLGVGLAIVFDSRRRLRAANVRLAQEAEARRRSELSLQRKTELHQALLESLGEGVGVFDGDDRFMFANPVLASAFGVLPDQLVGRSFWEFVVAERAEAEGAGALAASAVEGQREGEGVAVAAPQAQGRGLGPRSFDAVGLSDRGRVYLVTETRLARPGDDAELTLRVLRDLSERVASERRQRDLEREVERGQALQGLAVLAGGVAHDFNNLLSGVVGNAEFAQLKVPPSAPPQLRQCLAEIKEFATEAAQLSRQMLAYAGRRSLAIESIELNRELTQALRLMHSMIASRARLELDMPEALPPISADRTQLRQVLSNLVLNALEAMEGERGTIAIKTEFCALDTVKLLAMGQPAGLVVGDYVAITVGDTGRGIAPDVRERIFEPFFSTKAPGRGMGLAAAAGIVRSHRGWLGIESEVGVGTTFRILLPVARGAAEARPSPLPGRGSLPRGQSVLLIDDEPAVRIVTAKLLDELGQRVLVAESGEEGLRVFRRHCADVDLVVLDLTMPERSGSEVLGELRRIRADVRVVVTSGFHPSEASLLLAAPNVVGFLDKPHTIGNLEAILASVEAERESPELRRSAR